MDETNVNLLLSCIGKRGYLADYFRKHLQPEDRIIGTSNTTWTPGFSSCDKAFLLPDIGSPEYLPTLLDICREEHVNALLSLFDPDIDVLSQSLDAFRRIGVLPVVCSAVVNDVCFDKYETYLFLKEHRIATPATFKELEEVKRSLEGGVVEFPLVVKPRHGYGTRLTFIARNWQELEVFFHYAPNMILQEVARGGEHHFDILTNFEGQVISVVPKRKVSIRNGETDQAVTIQRTDLMDLGVRLGSILGRLGHVGPLDVDIFVADESISVLEMNPRFGGAYPAAHVAGADFPRLILGMVRGERVVPVIGSFRSGVAMMKSPHIVGGEVLSLENRVVDRRNRHPRSACEGQDASAGR